jgi:hypothetical protein
LKLSTSISFSIVVFPDTKTEDESFSPFSAPLRLAKRRLSSHEWNLGLEESRLPQPLPAAFLHLVMVFASGWLHA